MNIQFFIIIILTIIFLIIYSKNKVQENFGSTKIPKIIIQTWKDNNIPDKYKLDVESVRKINPDYKILFFTDKDIEDFLKKEYPDYYVTFQKLPVFIQKIDFFRYIAVYHYGGFYFDLDMRALAPLDDLLNYDSVFPLDMHITEQRCVSNSKRYKIFCDKDVKFLVGQYAFGAKPKHLFIKKLIDNIHNNLDEIIKTKNDTHLYVYRTTGPDYVTINYLNYNGKDDIYILEHPENQYFGNYAAHNFYGTWK